jgi:delta 1-pyrroline-5-carboxylate dehydrogenase
MLFANKAAPALAMGNTFICKPSERNCLSTMFLGKLFKEAGFPPGVMNVLYGTGNTGALLAAHPDVNKVYISPFFNPFLLFVSQVPIFPDFGAVVLTWIDLFHR